MFHMQQEESHRELTSRIDLAPPTREQAAIDGQTQQSCRAEDEYIGLAKGLYDDSCHF